MPDIVRMLSGKMLPRPLSILASTIAVTFVGPGKIPQNWLKRTFRVRRAVVLAALKCFKEVTHHPAYVDIGIDDNVLDSIPEDDIPLEILAGIRHEVDAEKAQQEAESYLHNEEVVEDTDNSGPTGSNFAESCLADDEVEHSAPDAFPLQSLGAVETDLSKVSAEELLMHSLANVDGTREHEGGYAVRHSIHAVNEFPPRAGDNPATHKNFTIYAFPWLYPYGEGGIEDDREIPVSFTEHVRCNLHYYDRRFRLDNTWAYTVFSIEQKRQALSAVRMQMRRGDFDNMSRVFSTLTHEDLSLAAEEESKGKPPSNPKITLLRRAMHSTGAKVMGSNASRASYRSQIWSTSLYLNPPSLWLTINPSDLHDPIVQIFAGENIDMDHFPKMGGPSQEQRARTVAEDPFATAKFFKFIIDLVLQKLFGIHAGSKKVVSRMGVLGRVTAYYGVVEAQGRGSLHVHMLLWLANAPPSDEMQALLQEEDFRQHVAAYVDLNIRAHLDDLTEEDIKSMERENDLAWSRPPDPDSATYEADLHDRERRLARSLQVHTCKKVTCLVYRPSRQGWVCKRHAPFPVNIVTQVLKSGKIDPKRTFAFLNAWNPTVLVYISCNNDIKFISNGFEARAIIWYITAYATKKQSASHNPSALLADRLAYHFQSTSYLHDIKERNRVLLFRCLHALNRQMEQSGQQVMSYLLGYGDRFCSHIYTPIYSSAIIGEVCRTWPGIKKAPSQQKQKDIHRDGDADPEDGNDSDGSSDSERSHTRCDRALGNDQDANEQVTIETTPTGILTFHSQLVDYKYRGHEFEHMNLLQFLVDTWESYCHPQQLPKEGEAVKGKGPGPTPHTRGRYLPGHPKAEIKERVRRANGHNVLPNIVGPFIPQNDNPDSFNFYCAFVLTLLKPWRDIRDIRIDDQSWAVSFGSFMLSANHQMRNVLSAAQYYYQCQEAASKEQDDGDGPLAALKLGLDPAGASADSEEEPVVLDLPPPTEAELEEYIQSMMPAKELKHGHDAIIIAQNNGLFGPDPPSQWLRGNTQSTPLRKVTELDVQQIAQWRSAMAAEVVAHRSRGTLTEYNSADGADVTPQSSLPSGSVPDAGGVDAIPQDLEVIQAVDTSILKPDQLRAYKIIENHVSALLRKTPQKQLLLLIQGEGGTGKSKVISCVTKLFDLLGAGHMLVRSAYTGIAASLIDGNTLHTLCNLSTTKQAEKERSVKSLEALRRTWKDAQYLVIDEISMVSREFLTRVSIALDAAKGRDPPKDWANLENHYSTDPGSEPFGAMNVILAGDFHQFPPVACSPSAALYWPRNPSEALESATGRIIYEMFEDVVILKEQCRIKDKGWLQVLRHAREGTCDSADLELLRSLVLENDSNTGLIADGSWDDAVLVTPRHAVRMAWNEQAVRQHCRRTGAQLVISPAVDLTHGRPLTIQERWSAASKKGGSKDKRVRRCKGGLPDTVEVAVGMEVMVTVNVETDLDVANGSRGVVKEIWLDRRESMDLSESEIKAKYPPECVLVQFYRTKSAKLDGLEDRVLPIVQIEQKYNLTLENGDTKRVTRRQLPMTPAYAFTDYRSQGQTIPKVIVDIGSPPTGGLTPFNAYVALSRSSGRDSIRLLRDFDPKLFTTVPCEMLKEEDRRLRDRDRETMLKYS